MEIVTNHLMTTNSVLWLEICNFRVCQTARAAILTSSNLPPPPSLPSTIHVKISFFKPQTKLLYLITQKFFKQCKTPLHYTIGIQAFIAYFVDSFTFFCLSKYFVPQHIMYIGRKGRKKEKELAKVEKIQSF